MLAAVILGAIFFERGVCSCVAGAKLFVALKTPPLTSPGTQTCVSEPQTALYAYGTQIKP